MTELDEARIRAIVQRVVAELGERGAVGGERSALPTARSTQPTTDGLFPNVDAAVRAATIAQQQFVALTLEKRGEIIAAMRQATREAAEAISRLAHEETGMGRWQDKLQKNLLVYGLGGIVVPFIGIKVIDLLLVLSGLA